MCRWVTQCNGNDKGCACLSLAINLCAFLFYTNTSVYTRDACLHISYYVSLSLLFFLSLSLFFSFFYCAMIILLLLALCDNCIAKCTNSICVLTHLYPVRMFSSVDFPAPEGPMIAVNSLDLSLPLTDLRIVFTSINRTKLLNSFAR